MGRWLFPHEVRAIRRLRSDGFTLTLIAWAFHLSTSCVSDVAARRSYSHVPDSASTSHMMDSFALEQVFDYYKKRKEAAKEAAAADRLRQQLRRRTVSGRHVSV